MATNDLLQKCNIKENNLCTFCETVPERLEHLFWHCPTVLNFWENVERWIYEGNNYLINLDKQRAILGITPINLSNKPINFILILTRYYIYKARINNKQLNLTAWKNEVKSYINIEKSIAIKNNGFEKFMKIWEKWIPLYEAT